MEKTKGEMKRKRGKKRKRIEGKEKGRMEERKGLWNRKRVD